MGAPPLTLQDSRKYNGIVSTISVSDIQNLISYTVSKDIEYVGYSSMGTLTSEKEWTIYNFQYSTGDLISKKTALNVAWDDRASLSYL